MKFAHFFVDRPIFAAVIAILIILLGATAYTTLPISQFPDVAPPTIVVSATYPGASAAVVADTVATPLEEEINGVEDMLYMSSQATADGNLSLTITFKLGTNLNTDQVLVQNRVSTALPRLPAEVQQLGVRTTKSSPDLMMVIHFTSPDHSYDQLYLSNFITLHIKDELARIDGVGDVRLNGARDYSMRIWLDPDRTSELGLTTNDVLSALRAQNLQVAAGTLNQPPIKDSYGGFQINVQTLGRLSRPEEFSDIVVKTDSNGRVTRISDIARTEVGAQDYQTNAYLDGKEAIAIGIFQRPGSNALATAERIQNTLKALSADFPKGVAYTIVYNPTTFISQSIEAVIHTIFEAALLVVLVVFVFLQTWRAALIPIIAIPISLIGTFAVMAALGISLNNLSLFGLVLAIGIVVDDAIVVVENVERNLAIGLSPKEAVHKTMDEVGSALVSIALVLSAVFVPAALVPGITGQFYRQFAATVAAATLFSLLVSLTLSPALCTILLKSHGAEGGESPALRLLNKHFGIFNRGLEFVSDRYGDTVRRLVRSSALVLLGYCGLLVLTGIGFSITPSGFIPALDQGYLIVAIQLPPGSSLERTDAVIARATQQLLATKGVIHTVSFAGFDGATFTNDTASGAIFLGLDSFEARRREGITYASMIANVRREMSAIQDAFIVVLPPPPIRGIGNGGGFKMMVEDRAGRGPEALRAATAQMAAVANQTKGLVGVFSFFETSTPQIYADIDRVKAEMLGVPVDDIFVTLSTYLSSSYVNDFNLFGRTYQVRVQADSDFRRTPEDIANLKMRSSTGDMVPLGSVATFTNTTSPHRVPRYNLYPAAELQGDVLPGFSSGQAIAAMEQIAAKELPQGFGYDWTDLSYQQKTVNGSSIAIFVFAVTVVFLVLAAQYESWSLPLAVILIVPMCLFASITGILIARLDNNILTQIGFVILIGLACKNAILIVEFAAQAEDRNMSRIEAAAEAGRKRLRPILMTSFAFILGVVPLVLATGAGAEMRRALGTAVFSGMLGVTFFGLILTPVFFTVCRSLSDRARSILGDKLPTHPFGAKK